MEKLWTLVDNDWAEVGREDMMGIEMDRWSNGNSLNT